MNTGDIWIIDHDIDDEDVISEVAEELNVPNKLVFMRSAQEVLACLHKIKVAPFVIICEMNLPGTDGFELREKILSHQSRKYRSVPFIFWSTQASETQIKHAFDLLAHGFFLKDSSFDELKKSFSLILQYWSKSKMPAKSEEKARQ